MRKALYLRFIGIISVTALLCGLIAASFAAAGTQSQIEESTVRMCKAIATQYEAHPEAVYLSQMLDGVRVTVIAADGTVLDDSHAVPGSLENHAEREEVLETAAGAVVTTTRRSETTGEPCMYAAVKLEDGTVLRVAQGYRGFWGNLLSQIPMVLASFFASALGAAFLAHAFTKKTVRPLEQFAGRVAGGDFSETHADTGYPEIDTIVQETGALLRELSDSQKDILMQHEKTNLILSNMKEGFLLVDENRRIVLMNSSAYKIFGADIEAEYADIWALSHHEKLAEAVKQAVVEQQSGVFDLELNHLVYSVHVSPVSGEYVGSRKNGATILLVNVDAQRKNQQLRSEFFSNASHELKTPVTSIMGFSEMLEGGLLEEENRKEIYHRMFAEAKRMNSLINDILAISRLESGGAQQKAEPVSLREVTQEVIHALEPQAAEQTVTMTCECEDLTLTANRRQIRELLSNLVENAILYNKPGGTVSVRVMKKQSKVRISISDTGIGIPQEAQSRIFERFYRVDSGRSKSVGGTGLGLSIVKHTVLALGGEISLKSRPDSGTKITIYLPM